jgi:O-acetylserine/cysteine efflux transporter
MKPLHITLAMLVAAIWGLAYVATRIALDSFSPPQLAFLRFAVACVPALLLPRPAVPVRALIAVGSTMFAGQFLLQFFGIANGMPPGLASVVSQSQALFTVLFAGLLLHELPTRRQFASLAFGAAGLILIGLTVGPGLTGLGLGLTLASAISWGVGNTLMKRLPPADMLNLVVWMALVPPLPALALSVWMDGPYSLPGKLAGAHPAAFAAVLYLGLISTVLAYAIWGRLLRLYPTAAVTPFALLAPCVGALSSAIVFGERFGWLRLCGMALILLSLGIVVLPIDRLGGWLAGLGSRQIKQ